MVADLSPEGVQSIADMAKAQRIVVKVGSALLVRDGAPDTALIRSLASDLAQLRNKGAQIIVVSSGAIALGAARLSLGIGGRARL